MPLSRTLIIEGTWTPILAGETTAGTNAYTSQIGTYKKFGKLVYLTIELALSPSTPAMVGNLIIKGLPFQCSSNQQQLVNCAVYSNFGLGTTQPVFGAYVAPLQTIIYLLQGDLLTNSSTYIQAPGIDFSASLNLSGWYASAV